MMIRSALLVLLLWSVAPALAAPVTVRIDGGRLAGAGDGDLVRFEGIGYAAPPVGRLRWRAPQPVAAWSGVRAADGFGPVCIQPVPRHGPAWPQSEDCLTLNIVAPAAAVAGGAARAVMVWIHGGGLVSGSGRDPMFDGAAFARQGIVLVTINYRLGQFGFFAHPALTRENADHGQLNNYGLMDQIAALRWVQRNIAAFGGDPKRVTIFGESAGGQSVDALLLAPGARGLFAAAIAQSGWGRGAFARIAAVAPDGKPPAEQAGLALMHRLGVDSRDPAALRALPADAIRAASTFDVGFGIVRDGGVVTDDLWDGFRRGHEAPVPLMIGSTDHEDPLAIEQSPMAVISDPYVARAELVALAPAYGGLDTVRHHVVGDVVFLAQARSLAALHAKNGYPAYRYRFAGVPAAAPDRAAGAAHGSELAYVFDTLPTLAVATGPSDHALATGINRLWGQFALRGAPGPGWPADEPGHVLQLGNDGIAWIADPWAARLDAVAALADPRS